MSQASRGWVQELLAQIYKRVGPPIVLWLIAVGALVCGITALIMVLVVQGYLDMSTSEFWLLVATGEVCAVLGSLLVAAASRDVIRGVLAWSGDARTEDNADRAWHSVAAYPAMIVRRALPVALMLIVASAVVVNVVLDLPWWALPVVALTLTITVAGMFVVILFGLELVLRPMLEEIAALLPADFEPAYQAPTIRTKALLPLPVVTLIAALCVPGFAGTSGNGVDRLTLTLGIAFAFVAVATAIFFIITRSSLDPIVGLTAATQRVRGGDLSTTVPVVSADDLGHLTADFNRMVVQMREAQSRIVAASDAARRQVERDLHDGAQQDLVLLNLKLGMIQRAAAEGDDVTAMAAETRQDLGRALAQLRDLAHGIYPATLENDGLAAALADAATRTSLAVHVQCDGGGRYPREIEAAVYFCCLEALQNAAKHAGDDARVSIRLTAGDGALDFEVADDGPGFDPSLHVAGAGLQNMADRIGALGGTLAIDSSPGAGTTIRGGLSL